MSDNRFEEYRLGARNVLYRLARHWLRKKADEVAGVPGLEGDSNFAIGLEAADTGAVAGVARSLQALEDTLTAIRQGGGSAEGFAASVAVAADIERVVSEIEDLCPRWPFWPKGWSSGGPGGRASVLVADLGRSRLRPSSPGKWLSQ